MGSLGAQELIIILLIVLLLFGARKLPELSKSIGQSIKEFRKASEEADADADETRADEHRATVSPPARED